VVGYIPSCQCFLASIIGRKDSLPGRAICKLVLAGDTDATESRLVCLGLPEIAVLNFQPWLSSQTLFSLPCPASTWPACGLLSTMV
jgi:hypothetical protein